MYKLIAHWKRSLHHFLLSLYNVVIIISDFFMWLEVAIESDIKSFGNKI